jgi:hypothetical protein
MKANLIKQCSIQVSPTKQPNPLNKNNDFDTHFHKLMPTTRKRNNKTQETAKNNAQTRRGKNFSLGYYILKHHISKPSRSQQKTTNCIK